MRVSSISRFCRSALNLATKATTKTLKVDVQGHLIKNAPTAQVQPLKNVQVITNQTTAPFPLAFSPLRPIFLPPVKEV